MNSNQETVTNEISNLRRKKNFTQERLAHEVGVTRQTIIAIEKGNYIPSVLLALKLSKVFNTTVNKLFTITDKS